MNVPQEIATKYNFLKQQTFESLGLVFTPGVVTFVPLVSPQSNPSGASYDNPNGYQSNSISNLNRLILTLDYQSTGGVKRNQASDQQLFTQIEEIMKSMTEHLANMTKGIVLEEENSFIQDSLSKKFLESLQVKDYHFTQLPREFMQRVDSIKNEFDSQIRKLIDHFNHQREEISIQNDRKIELLKQESNKYKNEVQSIRNQVVRQCMCKYYEGNMEKLKDEHQKHINKLKQKYENEIFEIRTNGKNQSMNVELFRDKIFTDLRMRVFAYVQEKNQNYINAFCADHNVNTTQIDPIELIFYICQRMEGDNNWLVDKLAEVQEEKRRLLESSQIDRQEEELLNGTLFQEIIEQTQKSSEFFAFFDQSRGDLISTLESDSNNHKSYNQLLTSQTNQGSKENIPLKRNSNYCSAANLRESLQSVRSGSLNKSQSGKNLNLKYQQIMKIGQREEEVMSSNNNGSQEMYASGHQSHNKMLGESSEFLNEYNR
ncbi:UNKNOWN [Stylonychia lemnae]|uniref:Uncharacterized protein n=1 Tax=Stylonychia lemnae TaxID=5949 RepID=A0A078AJK0_STYLE|nr:UNKNOWN [Stylonychia lemnae]|eukprot:CDW82540.1 UNKNOWN [Stylonychia lemnae]